MDILVETKNQAAIHELKAIFGLEDLKDIRDFAMTIAFPRMSAHPPLFPSSSKIHGPTSPLPSSLFPVSKLTNETVGGPMNYPTNTWQELNWYPAYDAQDFWNFCSNVSNIDAPASITDVDHILSNYTGGEPWTNLGNYANYFKLNFLPLCPDGASVDNSICFGTQNREFREGVELKRKGG
jgi:hypothetical protein